MFFKQIYRNAAKNRKGNGLFFGSLVIAIVAFYTLLSLGEQDVMRFLATIESDAVNKLMMLLPVVYIVSLFFVFFLVYFACKYQTDNRRREFGMYLMLGMKRSRLFFMLFCETLWSSLISLLIGLPVALFLTEGISLTTAKLIGLGIIGHRFSLSTSAIIWTVCGFVIVQMLSMLIICVSLARTEPADLFKGDVSAAQSELSKAKSSAFFTFGIVLILIAYCFGIFFLADADIAVLLVLVSGIPGTFMLFRGLGGFIGKRIRKQAPAAKGLETFTGRQVQENVIHQYKALAVCSLLLLLALSCVSYGISLGIGRAADNRSTDFSLFGEETDIKTVLEKEDLQQLTETSYPIYLSASNVIVNSDELTTALNNIEGGSGIARYLDWSIYYVISVSSYNDMMRAMGKEKIDLGGNKVALYSNMNRGGEYYSILDTAVKKGIGIKIDGTEYTFCPQLYVDNIVADRAITLSTALIVPDELYRDIAKDTGAYCYNIHLKKALVNEIGLMQAIQKADGVLYGTGLEYDSYLSGIGRNLFYTVAASYLTIYLGVLFLLIANTVIGLKYLIQQRQNKHRYTTLLMLGTDKESLCESVKKQIKTFFTLVLSVAAVSSVAAVIAMFTNLTRLPAGTSLVTVGIYAGVVLLVFIMTEIIYIRVVTKMACREIRSMEVNERRSAF